MYHLCLQLKVKVEKAIHFHVPGYFVIYIEVLSKVVNSWSLFPDQTGSKSLHLKELALVS